MTVNTQNMFHTKSAGTIMIQEHFTRPINVVHQIVIKQEIKDMHTSHGQHVAFFLIPEHET
jgi:hypothetical protein